MKVHPRRLKWIAARMGWIIGALVLVLLIWGGVRYRQQSRVPRVYIQIEEDAQGNAFVDSNDVRDILVKTFGHFVEGQTLEKIDVAAIESALEQDLFIEEADVYVDAMANVNISIQQRLPILRVMDVEDETYYLDAQGRQIPFSTKYTARVLVVTGDIGLYNSSFMELEDHRLRHSFILAQAILDDPLLSKQIEQIHINRLGDALLVPKVGNHKIYFGAPLERTAEKLDELKIFYKEAMPYEGWEKYKLLNLAFEGQIVAKKR